jgi:pimeloyl-ACP methyl ester carboxylesterase
VSDNLQDGERASLPLWLAWALERPGQSGHVPVDGRRLHYLSWGEPRPGHDTVLLIHGFRGHAHWWDAIAPYLAQDRHVVAMDLSGMGDSDPREDYPRHFASQDIIALIEGAGIGPVIGVGHSYGGSRMMRACADRPELFRRLVVCDSFVLLPDVHIPQDTSTLAPVKRHHADYLQARARYRLMPDQPTSIPEVLEHIAHHSLRHEPEGWCWKFDVRLPRGVAQEDDGRDLLPRVPCLVDIVYGEHSVVINREAAQRCVDLLPRGRGPLGMPGTYHHMMIDQPLAMIAMLRGLLANGEPT